MIDKMPAELRHIIIMVLAAALGWLAQNVGDLGLHPLLASFIGVVVGAVILWITPFTRMYGIGSDKGAE